MKAKEVKRGDIFYADLSINFSLSYRYDLILKRKKTGNKFPVFFLH